VIVRPTVAAQQLCAFAPEKTFNRPLLEVLRLLRLEGLHSIAEVLSRGGELIESSVMYL